MKTEPEKIFDPNLCHNEREVESKFVVSYLLPQLGYNMQMWRQETKQHRFRLDFLAYVDQNTTAVPKIVIETKHPNKNLAEGRYQLKNYMVELQIDYGVLTNGRELFIYKWCGGNKVEQIFRCYTNEILSNIERIRSLIGRSELANEDNYTTKLVQKQSPMKILAIYHNKGGVGKTTTTVNLADAIARTGKKVLIIDMDSQANTTFATGVMNFGDEWADDIKENYVYHLLRYEDAYPIDKIVLKARYTSQSIDVVPSHILLMKKENELRDIIITNFILREKINKSNKHYDVVIIDTPPSLNLYAQIALRTSDYLLIPSDLKIFANAGLENVKELIKEVNGFKKQINLPYLRILGILPTKILNHPKVMEQLKTQRIPKIEQLYGIPILKDYMIIERVDLAKSFDQTLEIGQMNIPNPQSIFEYNPNSPAVNEFVELANYVLQQMELSV